jgi:uncharacterized membrane protein (DUF106 family)
MKQLFLILLIFLSFGLFSQPQYKIVNKGDTIVSVKTMRHHRHTIDSTNKEIRKAKDTVKAQDTIIKKQADIINKSELKENILGKMSFTFLLSVYFFLSIGLFARWAYLAKKGVKTNPETPTEFHLGFWIYHNLLDKLRNLLLSMAVAFICFRFTGELFGNLPLTMFTALAMGLSIDFLIDKIMSFDFTKIFNKTA